MTKNAVYFDVHLKINEGRLDAFKSIAQAMIAATRKEPGALAYEFYFSDDQTRCRLQETYRGQAAVAAHLGGTAVLEFVPQMLQIATLTGFDVYGNPGAEATKQLAALGAQFFERWDGVAAS
jgi:quinol monooxygenase YgiN